MPGAPTSARRTLEIEEITNRLFIHPLSWRFVQMFAKAGVTPNTVSVIGMVLGAAAATCYYFWGYPLACVAGFLFMIGWHVMDGADGQLARHTGQTSEIGKVLDGLCDHGTFALVYFTLSLSMTPALGARVWALAAIAGASHLIQASAYEFQRQAYDYLVFARASARLQTPDEFKIELAQKRGASRIFGFLMLAYLRIQHRVAVIDTELLNRLEAEVAGEDGEDVRQAYRANYRSTLHVWSLLCSNYRTLAIFFTAVLGLPLLFFLFEIIFLNAALAFLMAWQRMHHARMRAWLAAREVPARTLVAPDVAP